MTEWTLFDATAKLTAPVIVSVAADKFTVLRDAAIAGAGIALLPRYLCRDDIHAVYPTRRHLMSRLRVFIDFAAEQLTLL